MRRLMVLPPILVILLCGFLAVSEETSPVVVNDIRMGVDAKGQTRLVLDLDGRPEFLVGPVGQFDQEIVVHLEGGRFALSDAVDGSGSKKGKGLIKQVTYGPNLVRLTLKETALPTRQFILPPSGKVSHHRLVIDLDPATAQEFAEAASSFKEPLDTPAEEPEIIPVRVADAPAPAVKDVVAPAPSLNPRRQARASVDDEPLSLPELPAVMAASKKKPLIVLDPGHGGHEPGSVGQSGSEEEDITLAHAKDLARILRTRGYEVLLTRNDDTYVRHESRIGLARERGADLFMSIHADSHEDRSLRGASVYTLSRRRSEKLEDEIRDDGNFVLYDVEVSKEDGVGDILLDLAQSATRQNSDRLAAALIDNMRPSMPLLKNPKRDGGLLVLLSPDVPAVLVELAFLSNIRDEANLTNPTWRRSAVTALADGIDAYFDQSNVDERLAGGATNSG